MNNTKIKFALFLFSISLSLVPVRISAQTNPNAIVENAVRFYFADIPIMIDIARCETKFKQYNPDGSAYFDGSKTYIGVFQFAHSIHAPRAASMGFDLANIDGNLQYARYLYTTSGTNPWKGCLPAGQAGQPAASIPAPITPPAVIVSGILTMNLNIGMNNPQVLILQQILNNNGFTVTSSGGGAPGQETKMFGNLTREAVKKFQCAKQIVCEGSESTTGFGRVGPKTRSVLNSL
jgi:hypothetical protein